MKVEHDPKTVIDQGVLGNADAQSSFLFYVPFSHQEVAQL